MGSRGTALSGVGRVKIARTIPATTNPKMVKRFRNIDQKYMSEALNFRCEVGFLESAGGFSAVQ